MSDPPRFVWRAPRPAGLRADFEQRVFAAVCEVQPRRPGPSQDETLQFSGAVLHADGSATVQLEYGFDHDYASQYDKTEWTTASVRLHREGRVELVGWQAPRS